MRTLTRSTSDEARQERIAKRAANTVEVELTLYYDMASGSGNSSVAASQRGSSDIETIPEFVKIDGSKVVITNRNYEQITELPEFAEVKSAIEKYIALVRRIEDWVDANCNLIDTSFSPKSMSRYIRFIEQGKRITKTNEYFYFDCRLATHQLRGQARTEARRTREDKYDDYNTQHDGKFILAKPIEIRINKANFESYDAAYDFAIKEILECMSTPM